MLLLHHAAKGGTSTEPNIKHNNCWIVVFLLPFYIIIFVFNVLIFNGFFFIDSGFNHFLMYSKKVNDFKTNVIDVF